MVVDLFWQQPLLKKIKSAHTKAATFAFELRLGQQVAVPVLRPDNQWSNEQYADDLPLGAFIITRVSKAYNNPSYILFKNVKCNKQEAILQKRLVKMSREFPMFHSLRQRPQAGELAL
jgi:hypothetical protein